MDLLDLTGNRDRLVRLATMGLPGQKDLSGNQDERDHQDLLEHLDQMAKTANVGVAHQVRKVLSERLDRKEDPAGLVRKATEVLQAQLDLSAMLDNLVGKEHQENRVALVVLVSLARMLPIVLVLHVLPFSLRDVPERLVSGANDARFIDEVLYIISSIKIFCTK